MATERNTVNRDYSDNFAIKETIIDTLASKYFPDIDLSYLNTGQLAFTMEQVANITEDSFNTASVLLNEIFPTKAVIPENILAHAAIFQIDSTFKNAASCSFVLVLDQKEILANATQVGLIYRLFIDKRTVFNVENIPFTLDYDIMIEANPVKPDGATVEYLFSARYVIDINNQNDVSDITDPFLKIRKLPNGTLLLELIARQVERVFIEDTVISNTKINYPVLTFAFDDALAGFDIQYKAPSDTSFTTLDKRIKFSMPVKTPFCYYRLKDQSTLEITFSTRDGYFKPDFNSEINVTLYTTKGKEGNFDYYNGRDISIDSNSETYEYNSALTMATIPVSASAGGTDNLSLDDLQALAVEGYSTATEISTEYDIMTYFYNFQYRFGDEIIVIKRRDDLTERLFSAFLLIKNDDYIYPTNTGDIRLSKSDFDTNDAENIFTLRPGHVFVYDGSSNNRFRMIKGVMAYNTDALADLMKIEKFVYTNPFMISVRKDPSLVGIYKTIANQVIPLTFATAEPNSFYQFITSEVLLTRSLEDLPRYNLSIGLLPSSSSDQYITTLNTFRGNNARIIVGFNSAQQEEVGYIELLPNAINPTDVTNVMFGTYVNTNDSISSLGEMNILNAIPASPEILEVSVPIDNCSVTVYILYKDPAVPGAVNKFIGLFEDMDDFIITNTYITDGEKLTFIEPMNMMRSSVEFTNVGTDIDPSLEFELSLLPMIKAEIVNDTDSFNVFIEKLTSSYNYMEDCLPVLRNNTNIDVKFYNTYGKSNNYYIGTEGELIDRVNISIEFIIKLVDGTDNVDARNQLLVFIKSFIEKLDSDGTNALYISNLIRDIETTFSFVQYLKFRGINDYDTDYQAISVISPDISTLTKEQRLKYVPEMIVINTDDIKIVFETTSI